MAINSYVALQGAIKGWLARTDLDAVIPEFIALAESEIRRRLRRHTKRVTITVFDGATALPADCVELRSLHLVTGKRGQDGPIPIVTGEVLAERRTRLDATGRPRAAAIVAGQLLLVPAPDDAYTLELTYFESLPALSADNPTNRVLTEAPDIYLFGAMKEAETYLEHDERVPLWQSKFEAVLAQLDVQRDGEEFNASLRPIRLPVVFG